MCLVFDGYPDIAVAMCDVIAKCRIMTNPSPYFFFFGYISHDNELRATPEMHHIRSWLVCNLSEIAINNTK